MRRTIPDAQLEAAGVDADRSRHQIVLLSPELARCSRCGHEGPWTDFPPRSDGSGKPRAWCRACVRAYQLEHFGADYHRARRRARDDRVTHAQHAKVQEGTGRLWCCGCRSYAEPSLFGPRDNRGVLPAYCREHKKTADARAYRVRRILGG